MRKPLTYGNDPFHEKASQSHDKPATCVNCSGYHPANSKQCPQWEKEKKILKIKCENNLSFPDRTYASAVKPGTCNKSTQTEPHRRTTALPNT